MAAILGNYWSNPFESHCGMTSELADMFLKWEKCAEGEH
jgi:hypothetical protein